MELHDQHVHEANVASWEAGFALGYLAYKLGVAYSPTTDVAWQQGWLVAGGVQAACSRAWEFDQECPEEL